MENGYYRSNEKISRTQQSYLSKISSKHYGFLDCTYGNNTATQIFLTNKSIVEMENRFAKDFNKILDSIIKLKSLIF